MQTFIQWLSNATPKTFGIANSQSAPGRLKLQVGHGQQIEGELDNLTKQDLQNLVQSVSAYLQQHP